MRTDWSSSAQAPLSPVCLGKGSSKVRLPGERALPTTLPGRALDASTAAGASSPDETQDGLGARVRLKGPQDVTAAFTKVSMTFA